MGGAVFITIYPLEVTRIEPPQRKLRRGKFPDILLASRECSTLLGFGVDAPPNFARML